MNRTLKDHVTALENRIASLGAEIMRNHQGRAERNKLEAELRIVQMALIHYREAIELEKKITAS